jgi:nicotinate phosphoribosyltransferase
VGTGLITSKGDSALDGVYKLVAMQNGDVWSPAMKISESREKTLNPGDKSVWRLYDNRNKATADLIGLKGENPGEMSQIILRHPTDHSLERILKREEISEIEPLLIDVLKNGELACELPSIEEMRERRQVDISKLDPGVRRIVKPHIYHVSISERLWDLKQNLIDSVVMS